MTPAKEKYQSRTEIPEGTLDMLILQVLHWDRAMDMRSARSSSQIRVKF
jgi:hypothetical protein